MASGVAKSGKMKRLESKKSHSWWWDSHITPKNNKWLLENLEEMDELIKRMLKLVEEDADSFAKKAELYFKKRPELILLIEEFYRMYRALAERYDLVSGELRKAIPSDLQSQGSEISDAASEPLLTTQSPERRPPPGPRAAGFDVFLGSGSEVNSKGDSKSTLDSESGSGSESESDDSSVNNSRHGNGEANGLQRRVIELKAELEELKEKLKMQGEETCNNCKKYNDERFDVLNKIEAYEEELRVATEKIQRSEEEITRLSLELHKYTSSEVFMSSAATEPNQARELQESFDGSAGEVADKIQALEEKLGDAVEKLRTSEKEAVSLRQELTSMDEQLKSAGIELSTWKEKVDGKNEEISKLQNHVVRYKTNVAERNQEINRLREAMSSANKSSSEENGRLQGEITRLTKEQTYLEDNIKELDLRCRSIEEEVGQALAAKSEMEVMFRDQIQQLKGEIAERDNRVEELNRMLDELKLKHDTLIAVEDELNGKIIALSAEIRSKDNQMAQMGNHLHQLHMQHVELIATAEGARKQADELQARIKELEIEVQRKQETINEGAERKREAIRQLCFSLEHYRSGYHQLRQAVIAHRQPTVMAT